MGKRIGVPMLTDLTVCALYHEFKIFKNWFESVRMILNIPYADDFIVYLPYADDFIVYLPYADDFIIFILTLTKFLSFRCVFIMYFSPCRIISEICPLFNLLSVDIIYTKRIQFCYLLICMNDELTRHNLTFRY